MTRLVAVTCVMACNFAPSPNGNRDGDIVVDSDSGSGFHDAPPDTHQFLDAPPPLGPVCGGKLWHATFDTDPTMEDLNEDGVADFAMRNGGALPGSLSGGDWIVPGDSAPLDTEPRQPFTTRTIVDCTMKDVARGSDTHSTICWINDDFTATTLAPLFVDLRRDSDSASSQTMTVWGKQNGPSGPVETSIDSISFGDLNFHTFHLDIDSSALTYDLTIDGTTDRGSKTFFAITRDTNDDEWATEQAIGGDSQFADFQVEVCP